MSTPTGTLRSARTLIAALLALDVVALLVFSVARQTTTRTTSTPRAPLAAAPVTTAPARGTPLAVAPVIPPAAPVIPVAVTTSAPSGSAHPSTSHPSGSPAPSSAPPSAPGSVQLAACPITITKTTPPTGGLQSLISLAPAFGEFSAEAFASAAAYQPLLQLLGPILAQYPEIAPKLAPLVNPLVAALQRGSNGLFALIGPLYSPFRPQILRAETKLASQLAPFSATLAASPLGGCLVQLETALVHDTQRAALTR